MNFTSQDHQNRGLSPIIQGIEIKLIDPGPFNPWFSHPVAVDLEKLAKMKS